MKKLLLFFALILITTVSYAQFAAWGKTDFSKHTIDVRELRSGGVSKFGFPPITNPKFENVNDVKTFPLKEPVASITIKNISKAYPLRYLLWHEVINDTISNIPIAITYCPLANTVVVYNRKVGNKVLTFAAAGFLRHSNLVMWDHQTESLWQQINGKSVVGNFAGDTLKHFPIRIESFENFKKREPNGLLMITPKGYHRPYGITPYDNYERARWPMLYRGKFNLKGIRPLDRVVAVGNKAWPLKLLMQKKKIVYKDIVITWTPGQYNTMDQSVIAKSDDVGNVVVQRKTAKGMVDVFYDVPYAFAFHAFYPNGTIFMK